MICIETGFAIVGMSGRFPGARNIEQFWSNLCKGVESVEFASSDGGRARSPLAQHPRHVPAYAAAPDFDRFDATFFGYSRNDAAIIDPQHRVFLECAWEVLEAAGYDADTYEGRVGVFASASLNVYLLRNILGNPTVNEQFSLFQVLFGNDKDFLASRVSYKLNLRGPSITVQTACSSSLVAVDLACQSLGLYQCDMALAGGVSFHDPLREGYLHEEEGILSRDGHCRAFDALATGTLMGSGAGIVVLKRLDDALRDGDHVHAVVRGGAVNNDGARKVGYSAPGVEGQAEVIIEAHAIAGVEAASIGYVEAHGTGTHLGDPIEVAALTQAFRAKTERKTFCALGSVKSNIGHLDAAAGITGLIKAALTVREGKIPPSVNFETPNPELALAESPFYVNTRLLEWPDTGSVRRAAVSSFGIGGTNAHVVLEEPPRTQSRNATDALKILPLSANSEDALADACRNLHNYFESNPKVNLDDVAYTLQVGRKHFAYRRTVLCRSVHEALHKLREAPDQSNSAHIAIDRGARVALVIGDASASPPSVLAALRADPHCQVEIDRWIGAIDSQASMTAAAGLYALAKLWLKWGICPAVTTGVGFGQPVADLLAGRCSWEQALELLRQRDVSTSRATELSGSFDTVLVLGPYVPDELAFSSSGPRTVIACFDELTENAPGASAIGNAVTRTLGALWLRGVPIRWTAVHEGAGCRRLPLPTYPFRRERHWIDPYITAPFERTVPSSPATESSDLTARFTSILGHIARVDPLQIDLSRSFFQSNLDSLSLMQLGVQIETQLGYAITFRQIADLDSPRALLEHLRAQLAPPREANQGNPASDSHAPENNSAMQRLNALTRELDSLRRELAPAASKPILDGQRSAITHRQSGAEHAALGPEQKRHVIDLSRRHIQRTQKSRELSRRAQSFLADPRNSHRFRMAWKQMVYPISIARARGAHVWDIDKNEYVDVSMGFGTNLFGHSPDFVTSALTDALESQRMMVGGHPDLVAETAQLLAELTGMERVTFCNTGSEAVMTAIRVARAITGRDRIALFAGSYHGNFEGVLVKRDPAETGGALPATLGMPESLARDIAVLEYCNSATLELLRSTCDQYAAVLVEPIQSRNLSVDPRDFLRELREITRSAGTLLIFDEVITGFRLHPGGAQAWFGIEADLATYGKILGGGMPIGALTGRHGHLDSIDGGRWDFDDASFPSVDQVFAAGTFNKHPFAMASARAVLKRIRDDGGALQRSLNASTARLAANVNAHCERNGFGIGLSHSGSTFMLSAASDAKYADIITYHLLEKGIHVGSGHVSFLCEAHGSAELDHIERSIVESIDEVAESGFVSRKPAGLPLSGLQREVWLAHRVLGDAAAALNLCTFVDAEGPLNVSAASDALRNVVLRHDALRMSFDERGRSQFPKRWDAIDFSVVDFSGLEDGIAQKRIDHLLEEEEIRPFDISRGPTLRALLVRLSKDRHVFAFSVHHISFDGWSYGVLREELEASHGAFVGGVPCKLPTPRAYGAYVASCNRPARASGDDARRAEASWRAFLETPTMPRLPSDGQRPPLATFAGARRSRQLGADLSEGVRELARNCGVSLHAVCLAAFQLLISGLTGQSRFVIGIAALASDGVGDKPMIGLRSNRVPVLVRINPEETPRSLMLATWKQVVEAQSCADFPLGDFLANGRLSRDPSRVPPFSAMFDLTRVAPGDSKLFGLPTKARGIGKGKVFHELYLNLVDGAASLALECDYASDLFHHDTIGHWLDEYVAILSHLQSKPDEPFVHLKDGRTRQPVHVLVQEQALINPDRVAMEWRDQVVTYRELDRRADCLAAILRAQAIGPDQRVAVCVRRSPNLIVCLLAVLKAGGTYVPLDPDLPRARIELMLAGSDAAMFLYDLDPAGELADRFPQNAQLDLRKTTWISAQACPELTLFHEECLAYLLYTSGSTGKPKGIGISHRALSNFLASMRLRPGLDREEVLAAVTTVSFDMAVLEVFLPLISGARVVLLDKEQAYDLGRVADTLRDVQATTLQATPSLLRQLEVTALQGLRVISGGEALPCGLAATLHSHGATLWNMYGPTETTVYCSGGHVEPGASSISLGEPVLGTTLKLLDAHFVQTGTEVGEIVVGGAALARGYWERPDLTAAAFVPDETAEQLGQRMYRTGDAARRLPHGALVFIGRLDRQVKVNGVRVELDEVEAVISRHPGVLQCAVLLTRSESHRDELVAYVVLEQGSGFSSWDLRKRLRLTLPESMIPVTFVQAPELPRDAHGKIDRRALASGTPSQQPSTGPQGALFGRERTVAQIWSEELNIEFVRPEDHFFDLGGNSFQAVQVIWRMKHELDMTIGFNDFLFKTLGQMVADAEGVS
jgi:amino acid adenylation domain-containing protein